MSEQRKFVDAISAFIGKNVSVETSEGKLYRGLLLSIDESLNAIIKNSVDDMQLIINGTFVKEIKLVKPFDVKAFVERLNTVFPGLVKVVNDTIVIMDKIRVTEEGVQGTGLAADRVRSMYGQFVRESR